MHDKAIKTKVSRLKRSFEMREKVNIFAICMHMFLFLISHTGLPYLIQMHAYALAIFLHVGFLAPYTCMQDGGLNIVNDWQLLSKVPGAPCTVPATSTIKERYIPYACVCAVPHHQFIN